MSAWDQTIEACKIIFYQEDGDIKPFIVPAILCVTSYFLGKLTARDTAVRREVGGDVSQFAKRIFKFSYELAVHQSGKPVQGESSLKASHLKLSLEHRSIREEREYIEHMLHDDESKKLDAAYNKWWIGESGDKGIIQLKAYARTADEAKAAEAARKEFLDLLTKLRIRTLRGKVKFKI